MSTEEDMTYTGQPPDGFTETVKIPFQPMTLRDEFAKEVLGSIDHSDDRYWGGTQNIAENIAAYCYRMADAMLEEREKKTP